MRIVPCPFPVMGPFPRPTEGRIKRSLCYAGVFVAGPALQGRTRLDCVHRKTGYSRL